MVISVNSAVIIQVWFLHRQDDCDHLTHDSAIRK